ncbi:MAG: LAO/AO transport system ATPase [actinobacterium acAMD-2]|nr:MAG: LAO/AO transport system ATPase [actinobacterium acAMD-2]
MTADAPLTLDDYVVGIRRCDRTVIGKALTLVESTRLDHRELAQQLVAALLPFTGKAQRIGITGVPGAGKSTLIDTLGSHLTGAGHQVAVLAVDPSSTRKLSIDPQAFIRPSPTSGTLGGVTRATREAMAVVEAAGFDVVLVETVGVGQSETAVANMVDCFVVLMLARTGDQLQGIKKGVLELADVIAVNKADGENATEASRAARELSDAMHLIQPPDAIWQPLALTCSGLTGDGVEQLWAEVQRHHAVMEEAGEIQARRARQQVDWMWSMVNDQLLSRLQSSEAVRQIADQVQDDVRSAQTTASLAAAKILKAFDSQ